MGSHLIGKNLLDPKFECQFSNNLIRDWLKGRGYVMDEDNCVVCSLFDSGHSFVVSVNSDGHLTVLNAIKYITGHRFTSPHHFDYLILNMADPDSLDEIEEFLEKHHAIKDLTEPLSAD